MERGLPLETRRRWATDHQPLAGKDLLVQGTGTGWDILIWAELKPRKIIAVDLFSFQESWREVARYCLNKWGVEVLFKQNPLEDLDFIPSGTIDVCSANSVYEHCKDLEKVARESFRILKPGGISYSVHGPLWFCAGGDHFAQEGVESAYNHILLDEKAYAAFVERHKKKTSPRCRVRDL